MISVGGSSWHLPTTPATRRVLPAIRPTPYLVERFDGPARTSYFALAWQAAQDYKESFALPTAHLPLS